MSAAEEAKDILEKLGLEWPDGDPEKLREAATAWRKFATDVDEVRTPVDAKARSLIHHNHGAAIDAFEVFWNRYVGEGDKGWLRDLPDSARSMAKALEELADAVDEAVEKLWTEIGISAAVIVAGIGLAFFTAGAASGAAVAASESIISMGASLGVTISATVARIAAGVMVGVAFGGVESVALDLAVAQPLRIGTGQQKSLSLAEVNKAAETGSVYGGVFGGAFGAAARGPALSHPGVTSPRLNLAGLRPNLIGPASRTEPPVRGEPVDVATGTMLMSQTDLTLPGSLPLVIERTHRSSERAGVWFGPSWNSTLDERVQLDAEGVVFLAADGMRLVYPVPEPGCEMIPLKGAPWPLEWDGKPDGALTITDPDSGVTRTFSGPAATEEPAAIQLWLESWTDRNGARIDVERDPSGAPIGLRHSGGYYVAVESEGSRVTALWLRDESPSTYEQPGGVSHHGTLVLRYGYDEDGNLAEVVNSSGKPLRFDYDAEGRMTSWTDRNGTSFAYVYDQAGRVVRTEGSEGVFNGSFSYDEEQATTVYTDSLGQRTICQYNADGQVVEETDPLGNTTRTEWDARGNAPLAVTDPLGHTTHYTYDEDGNLTDIARADGSTAHAVHNALGKPTEVTTPGAATWQHTYDGLGNLTSTVDPTGAETSYAYTDRGHLASVTDPLGHTRRLTCDAAGLPVSVTDALGHTTHVRRDAFGRIVEITDPLGHSVLLGWTTEGKLSWRQTPEGGWESWTWDGEGNLLSHTDAAGHTTRHTPAPFDVPATRTDPDGATYTFTHDTELRLTQVTNPQGLTWTYDYDAAGRLVAETDFNGSTRTYALDAAGRLTAQTNAADETLHYARDQLGRPVEQRADAGETTTYTYDAAGDLVAATNEDCEVAIERDALGRILSETVNGRTSTYAYDATGRCTRRTTPSGLVSQWSYDPEGRPTHLTTPHGELAFTHDAAGRETERRIGDGAVLTQTWDTNDRVTSQTLARTAETRAGERLLQHRAYAYQPAGYLTEIRELTSGTRHFTLDEVGRVTAVTARGWSESYAYDAAGNLTHATAPDHQALGDRTVEGAVLHSAGRTHYQHDAAGRLVRRTRRLLNGQSRTWTYSWNVQDQLVSATTPDGTQWHYAYDPLGRRISKTRQNDSGNDEAETALFFTWDDGRLAEETDGNGRTTTWNHLPGTHHPVAQIDHTPFIRAPGKSLITAYAVAGDVGSHKPRFHAVLTDPTGTPAELVTPNGELVWQHRTTLWGTDLPAPPDDLTCPLRFPGQYHDPETGLNYNYFRYYDPETARYLTPDPLGLNPAPNPHAYVHNPFDWMDPFGLAPCAKGAWKEKADFSSQKVMSKKYHAHSGDFLDSPGNLNGANLKKFESSMRDHMGAEGTKIYRYNYRNQGNAVGFIDPSTRKMVMLHSDGKFWSAFKLSDKQFSGIVDKGFLW